MVYLKSHLIVLKFLKKNFNYYEIWKKSKIGDSKNTKFTCLDVFYWIINIFAFTLFFLKIQVSIKR